jgi:phage antirepressor YoqD-like protein
VEANEVIKEKDEQIALMAPKVDAYHRLAESDGSVCLTDAAKALNVKPKELITLMNVRKWIYKRIGTPWIAHQDKLDVGYMYHRVVTVKKSDGDFKTISQALVTPKGLTKLAGLVSRLEVAA